MNKSDVLDMLVSEYNSKLRQPNDITLREFRETFERETGARLGEKKAKILLDKKVVSGELTFIPNVLYNGREIRVWRPINNTQKNTRRQ